MPEDQENLPEAPGHWELFSSGNHLRPALRGVYILCAVLGTLAVLFVLFLVVVEITTSSTATWWSVRLGVGAALISTAHVIWEARSTASISWTRWLIFIGAQSIFGHQLWVTVQDFTGRIVFLGILAAGGLLLFLVRLLGSRPSQDLQRVDGIGEGDI